MYLLSRKKTGAHWNNGANKWGRSAIRESENTKKDIDHEVTIAEINSREYSGKLRLSQAESAWININTSINYLITTLYNFLTRSLWLFISWISFAIRTGIRQALHIFLSLWDFSIKCRSNYELEHQFSSLFYYVATRLQSTVLSVHDVDVCCFRHYCMHLIVGGAENSSNSCYPTLAFLKRNL